MRLGAGLKGEEEQKITAAFEAVMNGWAADGAVDEGASE